MNSTRKEMKKMEQQQQANEQLAQLSNSLKSIDKMVDEFYADARERLMANDEAGFELIANSIFYFQDVQSVLQSVKVQFQTYIRTAQFMDTVEGIRPVLKQAAQMMNASPSFAKNSKDFAKFKKGLMKGQLNMKAMTSMMSGINPALSTSRSKEEFSALKERLLIGSSNSNLSVNTNTSTQSKVSSNEDFFSAINAD